MTEEAEDADKWTSKIMRTQLTPVKNVDTSSEEVQKVFKTSIRVDGVHDRETHEKGVS